MLSMLSRFVTSRPSAEAFVCIPNALTQLLERLFLMPRQKEVF
jgi:hypothetical protein